MVTLARGVLEQHRRAAVVADQDIDASVVVVVADRQPSRRKHLLEDRPGLIAHVRQLCPVAVKEEQRLLVADLLRVLVDHVVGMAVRQEEIDDSVVVVIEELQPPATQQTRGLGHAVGARDVGEELVPVVSIQGKHLLVDVGDEQILLAITVDVGRVHAHARPRRSVGAEADLRRERDFVPLPLTAVGEEEILHGIVGHEQVHQAVAVDVRRDDPQRLSPRALNVGPAVTSVKVPSPLLWKSRLGVGLKTLGMQ